MFPKSISYDYRAQRSSALVITLAAVVLISAIILVFFGQSTLHRQMSYTSAGQYRADLVAHTALDTIVGDLRSEITAGSTVTTTSGTNIYVPTANNTVVPCQVVANSGFTNLVKQSISGQHFWSGANYSASGPIRSAGGNNTAAVSWNGRSISLNEWNRPGLLGDRGSGTTPVMPAIPSYTPPDWVIVTRQGPIANTLNNANPGPATHAGNLDDKGPSNMYYVIGRYAYTIYDEGGLLDVNVAGFPSSISATDPFVTKRGMLPQVDLANIPGINTDANANALVSWRNAATASSSSFYTNYVFNTTNGFATVAGANSQFTRTSDGALFTVPSPGDQAFVSRQDLINFIIHGGNANSISSSALQYLGTFSRELNAPSYTPSSTLPAADLTSQNPSLINTPVTTSFTRTSDGTKALAGEPLIKYRFPLSRLALFGNGNSATDNGSGSIYKYFGLTRSSASVPWVYNHGTAPNGDGGGKSILLLSDVADLGREPDFFELLQAGILAGSLGQTATNPFSNVSTNDGNSSLHILQIGANLIDQYDTDSFPTQITLGSGGTEVDGIENLPYLVSVYATPYQILPTPPATSGTIGVWLQPEVWNPHGQAATPPSAPTQFRFVAQGGAKATFSPGSASIGPNPFTDPNPASLNDAFGIRFSTSTSPFSEPTLLSPVNATAPSTTEPDSETTFLGLALGQPITDPAAPNSYTSVTLTTSPVAFQLQYWDGTQWVTYSQMRSVVGLPAIPAPAASPQFCITRSDPRTDRFGVVTSSTTLPNITLWPAPPAASSATSGYATSTVSGSTTTWLPSPWGTSSVGTLSDKTSPTYYTDPDGGIPTGTPRPADGAYTDGTAADGGYPLATGAATSRPYILNRPFQSVAEMGYAFRDEPWKHLDFFTTGSADAALLDLFCVETPLYASPTAVSSAALPEAGRVDLNTRQTAVLQAVLQGVIMSEDYSATIAAPEAKNLASNLITLTTALPLLNRSELVTRWISAIPATTFDSNSDAIIKRRREAAVRALADVGNTRTWNLLIDVIAQSGRYGPTATTLDQFIVEGERRYWLHIAIDRYTNKVVAQYLEPVYE